MVEVDLERVASLDQDAVVDGDHAKVWMGKLGENGLRIFNAIDPEGILGGDFFSALLGNTENSLTNEEVSSIFGTLDRNRDGFINDTDVELIEEEDKSKRDEWEEKIYGVLDDDE